MEPYNDVSYQLSRTLTLRYSSSFGMSSKLFAARIQPHIYAIYGLVRVADEIVDTYTGTDKALLLTALEEETYAAIARGYSTNPIVQAFILTAAKYAISASLIAPFFESMRMDLVPVDYTQESYETYIYGSAEVIGLMCLLVFCEGNTEHYQQLAPGARALGAAYQKVNFLRDIASDYHERERIYFPGMRYESFDETAKQEIIASIQTDFNTAEASLKELPKNSRAAVLLSATYYKQLLKKLDKTSVEQIKSGRIRVSTSQKLGLLIIAVFKNGVRT